MPSAKVLKEKEQLVDDLAAKLKAAECGVLVDYKGIDVAHDTKLRKGLREAGVEYLVIKNTLLRRAFEKAGISGLEDILKGPTALALSKEDLIIAPKLVYKQSEELKEIFNIKGGFIEGKAAPVALITEYAKLADKETLISKLLFVLQSPVQKLAIAASEIAKKQESAA
ncbi:50S ribosomal protein L10 [Clostridia bacterium]|nr:50S ribosomal protein L10 [Clostridia bacterium]